MSKYNGWTNWETWKVNLELLDGLEADDLGIEHLSVEDAYEAGSIIRDYVDEIISMEYNSEGFVHGIVQDFLHTVDWVEIARNILDQWATDHPVEDEEEAE